ncbi:MAG: mannose-1-phosphate guanylyltransferase/mannose-6-phosphate isomerase [Pseudoalteromonas sp.]|uniref:mannose-1-phosphate guanylyltransferase/mannose-6-phosphate isomerase n=1 Tax=Pseudoalteromonas sp. TaxID=53249 RepID=UPI000C8E2439|nr:mannose-1-phosphate guanylyltransferase/mannose-6-phosphate isomerase [Pseudoalteromonas sp.]MAD02196.1 mannose-1-phosphate guanylyltransferase/mannose-6-phosphate isomerase [Pseudoalteromonas sp.]|tara:strand:+ start:49098 stop:50504 length:1407 start_codon:yes stop_codon:yes gene_type:complete
MLRTDVYPVILSGGSGTRLWPLSRKHHPKQFIKLISNYTMVQETALRLKGFNRPIAVCNEAHRFTIAEQLAEIGQNPSAIILEPVARNTAPAIALAAHKAVELNPNAILVVLAADHVIEDTDAFQAAVEAAVEETNNNSLITFGVIPEKPETGFGYIQAQKKGHLSSIKRFVEKPNAITAQNYVNSGDYYWNSGMFVFKAQDYLDELNIHDHKMATTVKNAYNNAQSDFDFTRVSKEDFSKCESNSIDYTIMEKTRKGVVLPISVGWNDVGSFSALWEVLDKDANGNANLGDVENIDSKNCLVQSENQFVATIGVQNLVVIGTKDSVLVANKDRVQDVKTIVQHLERTERIEHLLHREVHRPWGKYDSIDNGHRYQVKRITVKPGASLSKQMHHHRAEHWIVVSGTAIVEVDEKETLLSENQSIYIPLGATHRLTNPGKVNLELIEVQSGSYLGEDDIVRFEDNYNRK